MKTWLRLLLITATVGGGFMGLSLCVGTLLRGISGIGSVIVLAVAVGIFGYIFYAGLCACVYPDEIYRVGPALWLQIPWVTSPLIAYRLSAGFSLSASYYPPFNFGFFFNIGSEFILNLARPDRWGLGVNFAAVILLLLLRHSAGASNKALQPTGHKAGPRLS